MSHHATHILQTSNFAGVLDVGPSDFTDSYVSDFESDGDLDKDYIDNVVRVVRLYLPWMLHGSASPARCDQRSNPSPLVLLLLGTPFPALLHAGYWHVHTATLLLVSP